MSKVREPGSDPMPVGLPLYDHRRAHGKSAAFGAEDGKAALGECVGGDREAQTKTVVGHVVRNLPEQIIFCGGVDEVAVGADASAPVAQNASGIVGMIAQHTLVQAHIIQEDLESGGKNVIVGLRGVAAMGRGLAEYFHAASF